MNKNIRTAIAYILMIIVFAGILLFTIWSANHVTDTTNALVCSQNDITTFESHIVTFVIVDIQLHPLANMHISVACVNGSIYNHTTIDGSCSFLLEGSTKYTAIIENEYLEREKMFVLYPVNSCYLVVLEKRGRKKHV